jgi:hypothetical protein
MSSPSDVTHRISANYLDTLKEADVSVSTGMKGVLQYWINWQGKQRKISEQSSADAWDDTLITVSSAFFQFLQLQRRIPWMLLQLLLNVILECSVIGTDKPGFLEFLFREILYLHKLQC